MELQVVHHKPEWLMAPAPVAAAAAAAAAVPKPPPPRRAAAAAAAAAAEPIDVELLPDNDEIDDFLRALNN
jgi:hypothetical protein